MSFFCYQIIINYQLMITKLLVFFLSLACSIAQQPISASLQLVQYEPFVFKLEFSEEVTKPDFQLLLNNVFQLNYIFLTDVHLHSHDTILVTYALPTDTYFFQALPFDYPPDQKLENYEIIFNSPMKIGRGGLDSGCFMLTAQKATVQIDYSQVLGLLAVIAAYIMINFTVFGLAIMEFLQVYSLFMFKNRMKTTLYHQISRDLLLLNPLLSDGTYVSIQALSAIMLAPLLIILSAGSIGFLIKKNIRKTDSIIHKILYETFVYNLFINLSTIFLFPLFYNSIGFYQIYRSGTIHPQSTLAKWGSLISYLSIVLTTAIVYLFLYAINPKLHQSQASWKKYLKTQQFDNFRKLHQMVWCQPWYKRNQNVMVIMKRLLIGGLFFWDDGFQFSVFILQFLNIFFIFTVSPFKYEIYMNSKVVTRLMMFLFYGFVVVGDLYYSLGSITINYNHVKTYLLVRENVFLVIVFFIFLFIFYQIYNKCSNLTYQIRVVREQNQFRLKITEKQKNDNEESPNAQRKRLKSSYGESQDHSYELNTRFTTVQIRKNDSSPKKKVVGSLEKWESAKDRASKIYIESQMKSRLPAHLQLDGIDKDRTESYVISEGKTNRQKRIRQKWKKQSLLAEIVKDN